MNTRTILLQVLALAAFAFLAINPGYALALGAVAAVAAVVADGALEWRLERARQEAQNKAALERVEKLAEEVKRLTEVVNLGRASRALNPQR